MASGMVKFVSNVNAMVCHVTPCGRFGFSFACAVTKAL